MTYKRNLNHLIEIIAGEQLISFEYADALLSESLFVTEIDRSEQLEEVVRMVINERADVIVATTMKIPNLRFRPGKLLFEAAKSAKDFYDSRDRPPLQAFVIIRFMMKVRGLSRIEIPPDQARVLMALYVLSREEPRVTKDMLFQNLVLSIREEELPHLLEALEKLACIRFKDNLVLLNEEIDVVRRTN